MKYVLKIIFISLCFPVLTKCLIPTLIVRMVDQKLIDRSRQDTLEICRLFNQENKYLETVNIKNVTLNKIRRFKREIKNDVENPLLKQEDVLRVENIVEKLYDEMEQNGERVTYRKRNLIQVTKRQKGIKGRRFNFAPAELFGPLPEDDGRNISETDQVEIPWIKKWKHGIIPFFIDPSTYDSVLSETILKTFDYLAKVTCLRLQRLRERPTDQQSLQRVEWLYITNPSGLRQCVHSNERKPNSGVQMVVLGYDCLSQGEISHEIMHVLGFSHEHTRADRDQHVHIIWNNIKPGYKKYFESRKDDPLLVLPYDYASVLHYPSRAFSKNGQLTIIAQSEDKIGQREALSELDVEKIGMIYGAECVARNKDYLLKTCPSAVITNFESVAVMQKEIEKYFENRLWPYGIVNYKIRDKFEFTTEERDNINAVLKHIEKETCIEFRDIAAMDESSDNDDVNAIEDHVDIIADTQNITVQNDKENEIVTHPDDYGTTPHNQKMTLIISTLKAEQSNIKIDDEKKLNESSGIVLSLNRKHYKGLNRYNKKSRKNVSPKRRHSDNIIVLRRSSKPGCTCPSPGRPNGKTVLDINADCFNSVNDLLHMFIHVMGLDHQHNMHDRDSYLHIVWDNLTSVYANAYHSIPVFLERMLLAHKYNKKRVAVKWLQSDFTTTTRLEADSKTLEIKNEMSKKLPPAASAGFSYDYQSVMHYPWLQIKNGSTNIMYPIWNDGWAMGHWQGLSLVDVNKLNLIYKAQCSKRQRDAKD